MIENVKPKEQPILMSTPMVQALLAGTKTETRRDKNLKEINENPDEWMLSKTILHKNHIRFIDLKKEPTLRSGFLDIKCPWEVGNILWCKETWRPAIEGKVTMYNAIRYKADGASIPLPDEDIGWFNNLTKDGKFTYKSSMFMRRKFARIFLQITEIKLERLHDITEEGAIAEGILRVNPESTGKPYYKDYISERNSCGAITSYKTLWESINGEGSWENNPFVWVIKLTKIDNYQPNKSWDSADLWQEGDDGKGHPGDSPFYNKLFQGKRRKI